MNLFKGRNRSIQHLQESPLGYWEESSYMLAIPSDNSYIFTPSEIFERIKNAQGIQFDESFIDENRNILYFKLKYKNEDYEIGIYQSDFTFNEVYSFTSFYFTEEEFSKIRNAKTSVTIFMKFKENVKDSFHLQLKIAKAIVPDLIVLIDESAERMLPSKWVSLAVQSEITPGPTDIFNVHAVFGENNNEVWLHTHGLCRCGITELEILQSNKENYNIHYNLIRSYASFIIDSKFNPREEIAHIGLFSDRSPIIAICKSWTEAIYQYNNLKLGGIADRQDEHNSKTSPIFLYKNESDFRKNKLSKVTDCNLLFGNSPIFFFTAEETERMKNLSIERFSYVQKAINNKENKVYVKIGLPTNNSESEHIWFEILKFDGDKFEAQLTQEPYDVSNMHVGDKKWFTANDVTDWSIHNPKFEVNPNEAYLL